MTDTFYLFFYFHSGIEPFLFLKVINFIHSMSQANTAIVYKDQTIPGGRK